LSTKEEIAQAICDSEPFMWLMAGSNHTEMQLDALRGAYEKYRDAGGGYNKKVSDK
jgi:hypothetical protein